MANFNFEAEAKKLEQKAKDEGWAKQAEDYLKQRQQKKNKPQSDK